MAILVDFTKVWEDSVEVVYAFGLSRQMDRRLVIDKRTRRGAPADGELDQAFRAAYYKILYWQERVGYWPPEGSSAS